MSNILLILAITVSTSFILIAQSVNDDILAQNTKNPISLNSTSDASLEERPSPKKISPEKARELRQSAAVKIGQLLTKQVTYPSLAVDYCIEGTVLLEVSIGSTGKIQSFQVLKSPHTLLDKELSRSIKEVMNNQIIQKYSLDDFKVLVPFRFRLR